MISVSRIDMQNPLYKQEQELRNKVLLRPIGMPDHAWEMNDHKAWHFVAVDDNQVIGCVVLVPLDEEKTKAQLIQMAVDVALQGKGIGKLLIAELLNFSKQAGINEVTCHSRENAIPFYSKIGFEIYDEPFEEVGILHRHMRIRLPL